LCRFRPVLRGGEREVRMLTLTNEMYQWLNGEEGSGMPRLKGNIRAHLGVFVRGERIDDLDFMKKVEDRRRRTNQFSHGVWSISPRFNPQYRLFGYFATLDWFVALTQSSRDELAKSDARWHAQIDRCGEIWISLFPGRDPWTSDNLRDYVSRNVEKRDDRW
jgi:hypothetical protein